MHPPAISTTSPTPTPNLQSPRIFKEKEMSMIPPDLKAKAEVYYGDETCREKFILLLTEIGLPNGLLVIEEIEECGYVKDTGFVWLKQKKKRDYYKFDNILVCYDNEVTAYFEHNKIKKLTGVKAKDFLIWITLSEINVNQTNQDASITFRTPSGLSRSFPLSMFIVKDVVVGQAKGRK